MSLVILHSLCIDTGLNALVCRISASQFFVPLSKLSNSDRQYGSVKLSFSRFGPKDNSDNAGGHIRTFH